MTNLLLTHFLCHRSVTADSRSVAKNDLFFALRGDRFNGNEYASAAIDRGASLVVIDDEAVFHALDLTVLDVHNAGQPGPFKHKVDSGLVALQQLATAYRRTWQMPVVAITGSNGKTTTKELITSVLAMRYDTHATQGNYNNHIGVPLTMLSTPSDADICILEMGANHQGEIALLCRIGEPTHGLITNIGQAHLEGFGGREGIKKGKGEMFDWLGRNGGVGFVNQDQAELVELSQKLGQAIVFCESETPSMEVKYIEVGLLQTHPNCSIAFLDEQGEYLTADTHLPGKHNFENIKAAVAIGKYFKVPGHSIVSAIESYRPENGRSQMMTHRAVDFFWDAYNANPTSVKAALDAFVQSAHSKKVAILGEMLELGEETAHLHKEVAEYAKDLAINEIVLVGGAYQAVATALGIRHFADSELLSAWFWTQDWDTSLVFVKGSRSVALENILK